MSYSFNNTCWNCKEKDVCTDTEKVQAAIDDIHSTGFENGHKGGGEILILCSNHDQACPDPDETEESTH